MAVKWIVNISELEWRVPCARDENIESKDIIILEELGNDVYTKGITTPFNRLLHFRSIGNYC